MTQMTAWMMADILVRAESGSRIKNQARKALCLLKGIFVCVVVVVLVLVLVLVVVLMLMLMLMCEIERERERKRLSRC